jgi:hypothetical protein
MERAIPIFNSVNAVCMEMIGPIKITKKNRISVQRSGKKQPVDEISLSSARLSMDEGLICVLRADVM